MVKRSLKIVDKVIVAVSNDDTKDYLFTAEERVSLIKDSLFKDLNYKKKLENLVGEYKLDFKFLNSINLCFLSNTLGVII